VWINNSKCWHPNVRDGSRNNNPCRCQLGCILDPLCLIHRKGPGRLPFRGTFCRHWFVSGLDAGCRFSSVHSNRVWNEATTQQAQFHGFPKLIEIVGSVYLPNVPPDSPLSMCPGAHVVRGCCCFENWVGQTLGSVRIFCCPREGSILALHILGPPKLVFVVSFFLTPRWTHGDDMAIGCFDERERERESYKIRLFFDFWEFPFMLSLLKLSFQSCAKKLPFCFPSSTP
jgi:hypothetical protein